MLEVFLDAVIDSLKVFPVVFIVYVIIEYIEAKEALKHGMARAFTGRFSPVFGAMIGVIPQCGFSVVATKLYQGGYIYLGTLIAVYFATSDEAVPILLSRAVTDPSVWKNLGLLIAVKFVYAIIVGMLINLVLKHIAKMTVASASGEFAEESFEHDEDGCCGHGVVSKRRGFVQFIIHPLLHSLKIVLYIFIVNLLMGMIIDVIIGEDAFKSFLSGSVYLQPLLSVLIGLIPNCASSVVITELYVGGALNLSGAVAGLTANSGLGLAVLLKDKQHIKRSLLVIGLISVLSVALGYAVLLFEI